jgi:hypothetical protein
MTGSCFAYYGEGDGISAWFIILFDPLLIIYFAVPSFRVFETI